jgi:hypothetical protein
LQAACGNDLGEESALGAAFTKLAKLKASSCMKRMRPNEKGRPSI